jgi:large subunit ribosomal protein L15
MFELNKLRSSGKSRKRIGRGGSRGGSSGRGNKGQKARSGGGVRRGFEGGQMPLHRRLPKSGFNNAEFKKIFSIVNLGQLENIFKDGETVDFDALVRVGLVKIRSSAPEIVKKSALVKILAQGTLQKKLVVTAHAFSEAARAAIENSGGRVNLVKEM